MRHAAIKRHFRATTRIGEITYGGVKSDERPRPAPATGYRGNRTGRPDSGPDNHRASEASAARVVSVAVERFSRGAREFYARQEADISRVAFKFILRHFGFKRYFCLFKTVSFESHDTVGFRRRVRVKSVFLETAPLSCF